MRRASEPTTGLFLTDLDGTLRTADGIISDRAVDAMRSLGARGYRRVIATGRSLHSALAVLPPGIPIDYLVFSSGAGIVGWEDKALLRKTWLEPDEVNRIVSHLVARDLDFMVHHEIPDNHRFCYRASGKPNPDFERRVRAGAGHAEPWKGTLPLPGRATQFVVVSRDDGPLHATLEAELPDRSVIRTTSPLDHRTTWVEIFAAGTKKSGAAAWIAEREGCAPESAVVVGNDYNDLDLLRWARHAFVVAEAPEALRREFGVVGTCRDGGLADAVAIACRFSPADQK